MVSANEGWAVGNGGTIVHGIRHPADADLRLSIKYAGNGTGTVTDTLASGTLVLPSIYAYGSVVTLTASADADSLFAGWSGDVTGLTNPITLTMDSNKTVTATFSLNIYMPTVITVTTTTDELNNDGDCSLREAVQASNTDTAVDACPAGNGDDAIILSANTYTLTIEGRSEDANAEGDLDVTGVLTITGMGAPTTTIQSGADAFNGIDRVIHVLSSSNLTIQNVQIRNGLASYGGTPHIDGGGIYVAENSLLNIDNCTIAYNWGANGGGITSAANTTVNINNSIISNNHSHSAGGGLMSYGTVNIGNTTFDRNTGMFGGAVSAPNGNITNSTFSENSAVELIGPPGYGAVGGATVSSGVLNISNSTISGNTAVNEGGGIRNSGQMHISSCTITDNESPRGGGILDFGGIVTVTNSVIAANAGGNCSGAIVSSDYNIDSDNTCNLTRPNDQANMDPMLDPLADNGGPTWTHALSPGSLAINTGDCSGGTITVDQRSVTRPQGYACDIGAYEYDGDPFVITTDDSFTVSEDVTLVVGPPGVLSNDLSFSTLTTALGISPTNGALSFDVDGSFLYTPTSNFSGMDWFTYVASDGTLTDTAVVTITIVAVNDAPIAIEDVYTTTAGTTLTVLAPGVLGNDTDAEREPLLAVLDTLAMSGTLVFNPDGSFVYTPDTGFIGVDSFTYHASDRSEDSNQIAVKVMVNPTLVYLPIVRRK
jgi:CSLREA domain-containing protein